MECKICKGTSCKIFELQILNKYQVAFFQCNECEFIQTEEVHWLSEVWSDAISAGDTGILSRNVDLSMKTQMIIESNFDPSKKFLDYGGGYGIFVRLMRDRGYDFYRYDKYCQNIFAQRFDVGDSLAELDESFELVTAFEVFEHLEHPMQEIQSILGLTDSILFSTMLIPDDRSHLRDWWYLVPQRGAHIAFYSLATLKKIAGNLDCHVYSNGSSRHLLARRELRNPCFLRAASRVPRAFDQFALWLQELRPRSGFALRDSQFAISRKDS